MEKDVHHATSNSLSISHSQAQQLGFVSRHTYLTLIPVCCILLSVSPFSVTVIKRLKNVEVRGGHGGGKGAKGFEKKLSPSISASKVSGIELGRRRKAGGERS